MVGQCPADASTASAISRRAVDRQPLVGPLVEALEVDGLGEPDPQRRALERHDHQGAASASNAAGRRVGDAGHAHERRPALIDIPDAAKLPLGALDLGMQEATSQADHRARVLLAPIAEVREDASDPA